MLQGSLLILKIVGILLLGVLGLCLVLLLLLLFVPLRYRLYFKRYEDTFLKARISWMGYLLFADVIFCEGKLTTTFRVLGISIKGFMAEEESGEYNISPGGKRKIVDRLRGLLQKLKYTISRIYAKIKELKKTIAMLQELAADVQVREALKHTLTELLRLGKLVFPRKIQGNLHFGMEDPALTGEVLGGISIFYPIFMDTVKIVPDFEQAVLEGELKVRGSLYGISLLFIAWRLWKDENIHAVYRRIKIKGGATHE